MAQVCDICGKRAAIRKYHQPRPQRVPAALERQPAPGSRQSEGRHQAHPRLHLLPAQRQSGQGLRTDQPQRTRRFTKGIFGNVDFLCDPSCPLWLKPLLHAQQFEHRRSASHSAESTAGRPASSIGEIRRNPQLPLAADLHPDDAFIPALDHRCAAQGSNVNGSPRSTELSNFLPLVSHPV